MDSLNTPINDSPRHPVTPSPRHPVTPSPTNRLLTNALVNWAGFAAQLVVALWLAPVLLHGLGERRYGIWFQVESVLAYLMLFDLGVAASVVRYVARFEAQGDRDNLNRVFSTSVCLFMAAGAVVLALAALGALAGGALFNLPPDLASEARWLLLLLGFNLAVGLPLNVFPSILDGLGRYPVKTAARTLSLLIRVPLFLWVVQTRGGLIALAGVITGLNLLEHLVMALIVRHYLPGLRFSLKLADRATFRTIRGYSLDALLAMIAGRISFQTDALVIGAFLAPQYITFFAVAAKLVEYAKSSLRTATTVLTPAVSSLEARGDTEAIRRVLVTSTRYVLWIMFPVQAGLMVLGKPFLAVWLGGPRYADLSYPTLFILALPVALIMSQSGPARILYGIGRLRWFARVVMAEALVNLALSVLLIRPLGIEGVAWGTTIPNILASLAIAAYVCRTLGESFPTYLRRAFLLPLAVTLVPAGIWLLAVRSFDLHSWGALFLAGAAGLALYLPAAMFLEFGPGAVFRPVRLLLLHCPRFLGGSRGRRAEVGESTFSRRWWWPGGKPAKQ
jgi:O-antigen/teichoic acid export membrane protein